MWAVALTAASIGTTLIQTYMGVQQARANKKQIAANAAWARYQDNLETEYEKQKKAREQYKLMSEQRARMGASGAVAATGSLLTASLSDLEEYEDDMMMLSKMAFARTSNIDVEARGLINDETNKMWGTIISGAADIGKAGMQYNQMKAAGID
tara:strand:+ start:138 stop:596 length:459 start_codon:yes stop_codon:yes gene_type:complete